MSEREISYRNKRHGMQQSRGGDDEKIGATGLSQIFSRLSCRSQCRQYSASRMPNSKKSGALMSPGSVWRHLNRWCSRRCGVVIHAVRRRCAWCGCDQLTAGGRVALDWLTGDEFTIPTATFSAAFGCLSMVCTPSDERGNKKRQCGTAPEDAVHREALFVSTCRVGSHALHCSNLFNPCNR